MGKVLQSWGKGLQDKMGDLCGSSKGLSITCNISGTLAYMFASMSLMQYNLALPLQTVGNAVFTLMDPKDSVSENCDQEIQLDTVMRYQ